MGHQCLARLTDTFTFANGLARNHRFLVFLKTRVTPKASVASVTRLPNVCRFTRGYQTSRTYRVTQMELSPSAALITALADVPHSHAPCNVDHVIVVILPVVLKVNALSIQRTAVKHYRLFI